MESKLTGRQEAISGAIAGITSRFVIAPFDVVKIRFQLQSTPIFSVNRKYATMIQSTKIILKEEGIRGLWKGNVSATMLYFCYGGVQFYTYSKLKTNKFVSGAISGLVATTLTYPFDTLRTRFAAQQHLHYVSIRGAIKEIIKTEGIRGFYKGLVPSLISIAPQMGLVFEFHHLFLHYFDEFSSGGLAGIASKTIMMPLDVIRKRLQVQGPIRTELATKVHRYKHFLGAIGQIVRHEGFLALYKGWVPSVLKAGPSSAITFFVVDQCHVYFKS